MKKMQIEELEKIFYKKVISNRYRLILMIVVTLILANVSHIPYLNLFLTKEISLLIFIFIGLLVFNLKSSIVFQVGIFLFLPAFLFQIVGKPEIAEMIGNLIYIVFLVGIFKGLCHSLRKTVSGL